ncbi:hypothetical protein KVV02_000299 [Mortierella alpina]|uniref:Pentacotripeptide-repeat region of PRORP domain-containing protein n=1 Tax=Mortierella alpina TaxID=64518 RepID=A0A9P8D3N8_MORAP|nr:hypothetical protein KVV02_000299 [Mortierella alpina]
MLDFAKHIIVNNRIRTAATHQRWRTLATALVQSKISQRASPATSPPSCRSNDPGHGRLLTRHTPQLKSRLPSIPLQSRQVHSCSAPSSFSAGSKAVTKRSSSSTAAAVSHSFPAGPAISEPASAGPSSWYFPQQTSGQSRMKPRHRQSFGPLPLPIALKALRPSPTIPTASSVATDIAQIKFPPAPAVLGSQPLYYLARRFPVLAEQELKAIPNKTALDYSSFLIGAMSTSYPSATTLRAVVRQFRNFLKESSRQLKMASGLDGPPSSYLELPRARIWTQTIRGLIWLKQYRRARVAIHAMQKLGIKPTGYAWSGICRGWIEQGQLDRAEALALNVFTKPEISHDYHQEEKPYYFPDMHENAGPSGKSKSAGSSARRTHRSPMSPNSAPLCLVIEALAECGEMGRARHLFDQIPEHEMTDMLTSDMVAGYLRVGQQDKAQEVIKIMARCGVRPTAIVFNPIVEHAVKHVSMEAAEEMVQDMVKLGIFLNLYTYKILVRGYIAAGQRDKALECIDRIRASGVETDRALGRILLEGFWRIGELRQGDHGPPAVCDINRTRMMRDEMQMESLEFVGEPGWSRRCIEWIQSNKFELAEEALHQVLDHRPSGLDVDAVEVIKALADRHEMTRARHWFDLLLSPEHTEKHRTLRTEQDTQTLADLVNSLVSGYIQTRQPSEAEAVIGIMSRQGIQPNVDTINLILQWSTVQADMKDAEALVQRMAQSGISPNQQTFEILCQGYAARGALESLRECLTRMEEAHCGGLETSKALAELCENVLGQSPPRSDLELSWSSPSTPSSAPGILDTICTRWIEQDQMSLAEEFVDHLMSNPCVQPNKIPFNTLIQGWIHQSQLNPVSFSAIQAITNSRPGTSTYATATLSRPESESQEGSPPTSSSVPSSKSLHQESRLRQESIAKMRKARSWFDKVPEQSRTLDLLNKMIGGYMALGLEHESEGLIQWMASHKIKPDVVTYNHMLEHTIQRVTMPAAQVLVREMQKGGIQPNVETWNLMVRGYVMRGQLSHALRCLDIMAGTSTTSSTTTSTTASTRSKTREIMESYDREILDVVVQDDEQDIDSKNTTLQQRHHYSHNSTATDSVQVNGTTVQLILSGFGPELKPPQGQGDYARALELYRNRVERQRQQKDQLMEGLAALSQRSSSAASLAVASGGETEEAEDEWIFEHLETLQELGGLSGSDIGMTDHDWKNELQWEEMMEVEKGRERELSGR